MSVKISSYDCENRRTNPLVNDWNEKHTFIYSNSYVASDVKAFKTTNITRRDIEKYNINYEFVKVDNLKLAFDLEYTFDYDISEEKFNDIDEKLKECLSIRLKTGNYKLTTASRFIDKKLSYHIIMQFVRMNKKTITPDCFSPSRKDEYRLLTTHLLSCFTNKYPNMFSPLNREHGKICILDMVDPSIYAGHDFFKVPFAKDDRKPYPHIPVVLDNKQPVYLNNYLLTPFNENENEIYSMVEFEKKVEKEDIIEEDDENTTFPYLEVDTIFYEKLGEKVDTLHHCHYCVIVKISKTLGYYDLLNSLCAKSEHYNEEKLREFYEQTKCFKTKLMAREKLKMLIMMGGKTAYKDVLRIAKGIVYEHHLQALKKQGSKTEEAEKLAKRLASMWMKESEEEINGENCKPLQSEDIISLYIEAMKGKEELYIFNDGTAFFYDEEFKRWEQAKRYNDKPGIIIKFIKRVLNESIDTIDIMVIIATLDKLKGATEIDKTIKLLWGTYRLTKEQDQAIRKRFFYYEEKCIPINDLHVDVRGEEVTARIREKHDFCTDVIYSENFRIDFECEEYKKAFSFMKEYSTFNDIFNEEHFNSLKSITGACLSGVKNTDIKKLICIIGSGSNGKSTYFELMSYIMGMGSTVSTQLITQTKSVARVEEKCLLEGKRFYVSDELDANFNFNITQLKKLTGQTAFKVRDENRGETDIELRSLFVISTNELPSVQKMDGALEKRLIILPFLRKFEEDTGESIRKIKENKNGLILFYLHCMQYFHQNGIQICTLMEQAKQEYKGDNEQPFDTFCKEKLEVDDEGKMKLTNIIDLYKQFYSDNQYPYCDMPGVKSNFWKKEMIKNGFTFKDTGNRNNVWFVRIKEDILEEREEK